MYLSDDGDVLGLRYDNWKIVFMEQRCQGTLRVWAEPFTKLRVPKLFNLRTDPFERADITSNSYYDWFLRRVFMIYGAQAVASQWAATFKDFPPIQKPNTFTLDDALEGDARDGRRHALTEVQSTVGVASPLRPIGTGHRYKHINKCINTTMTLERK